MSKWILIGPLVGALLITLALIFGYVIVPPMIVQRVTENVQMIEGTDQFNRWVKVPQPLQFKVYIFNVTNVEEIQRGLKPKVQEVGPYIYTQTRLKYDINFSRDRERVAYFQQQTFHFDAEKSSPWKEDDTVIVPNMLMNSVLKEVERTFDVLLPALDPYLESLFVQASSYFLTTTPKEFLFDGFQFCKNSDEASELICGMVAEKGLSTTIPNEDGPGMKFSMFNHKNRTHDGEYEVNTGIRRLDKLLQIQRWKGSSAVRAWLPNNDTTASTSTCQQINGTDGTSAGAFREEGDDFYVFSSDICRSVHLYWNKKITYSGIPGYRYASGNDFLNEMPDCFCSNHTSMVLGRGCLPAGALDLTDCLDAPIIGSMPHFLNADPIYRELIDGLTPDEDKHSNTVDIEPYTGSPLRGGKKFQFNMILEKIEGITLTENFAIPRLFPILWVDEGVELNEDMVNLIKGDLTNVLRLISILQWTFVGVGAALMVGMLIWFYFAQKKRSNRNV